MNNTLKARTQRAIEANRTPSNAPRQPQVVGVTLDTVVGRTILFEYGEKDGNIDIRSGVVLSVHEQEWNGTLYIWFCVISPRRANPFMVAEIYFRGFQSMFEGAR